MNRSHPQLTRSFSEPSFRRLHHRVPQAPAENEDVIDLQVLALPDAVAQARTQELLAELEHGDACLNKPVSRAFLFAAVEHLPGIFQHTSSEAAESVMRHCLKWAGALPRGDQLALLDRLRRACPPAIEAELQDMFLRLLGVDRVRLTMFAGPFPRAFKSADWPLDHTGSASTEVFPFFALPEELRRTILHWVIPEPGQAHFLPSVRAHAATLMPVCQTFQHELAPRVDLAHRWPWTRVDRLPASAQEAIEGFQQLCIDTFGRLRERPLNQFTRKEQVQLSAEMTDLARYLKQLACVIGLTSSDVGQVSTAMASLFAAARQLDWLWLDFGQGMVADVLGQVLCLAYEGRESAHDFQAVLQAWRAGAEESIPCLDIELHLGAYAPAHCLSLVSAAKPKPWSQSPARKYQLEFHKLSDGQRWRDLQCLRARLSSFNGSLSTLWLIAATHQASVTEHGCLVASEKWWNFAAAALRGFLVELDTYWPHDAGLPVLTLFRRLPGDLLRWTFQTLDVEVRESLLLRPLAFDENGDCLQWALLCDFCLDPSIPEARRANGLGLWQRLYPALAKPMQTAASQWETLSGPPLLAWPAPGTGDSPGFQQALADLDSDLTHAGAVGPKTLRKRLMALMRQVGGPEDFAAALGLAGRQGVFHLDFLFWVLDRLPRVCRDSPWMLADLVWDPLSSASAHLTDDGQQACLDRLVLACEVFPAPVAAQMLSALTVKLYGRGQEVPDAIRACLPALCKQCLEQYRGVVGDQVPVKEAWVSLAAWRQQLQAAGAPAEVLEGIGY